MTNDEIKEAIKDIERYFDIDGNIKNLNGIKVLLALAEEYLKVKGWPKEEQREHDYEADGGVKCGACIQDEINISIRLCKLAAMSQIKMLEGDAANDHADMRRFQERFIAADQELRAMKKEIKNIIAQPPDRISKITIEDYEQIRQKLLELINGKEA